VSGADTSRVITVVWWNLQRFFHFRPSPLATVLGSSARDGWTREVYEAKVRNVAAVLRSVADPQDVGLVGFAEVENDQVVADVLMAAGWTHLTQAEEPRFAGQGYDVAVAYDPAVFTPLGPPRSHNVHLRFDTRDILEVPLRTPGGAELLVLANHWPSRRISSSGPLRIGLGDYVLRLVGRWLKVPAVDMVRRDRGDLALPPRHDLRARWQRPVIVMGDFNDQPFDPSVAEAMDAYRDVDRCIDDLDLPRASAKALRRYLRTRPRLFNPSWKLLVPRDGHTPPGTTHWNGRWYLLDQIILSQGAVRGPLRYVDGSLRIACPESVRSPEGDEIAVRKRSGRPKSFLPVSRHGASDHFPVVMKMKIE
jgi:endonuclease/exonuclease/phosphatase family metal-dependent hydrolase